LQGVGVVDVPRSGRAVQTINNLLSMTKSSAREFADDEGMRELRYFQEAQ